MIYIRVDVNDTIATGHLMRCLAIADAASILGDAATFLLADGQGEDLVRARGHHAIVLHTKWNDMQAELPALFKVIKEHHVTRLLIDSYQVTKEYLGQLKPQVQTFYIDDVNAFLYPVHAVICYANYWKRFQYQEHYKDTSLYLGTAYIPLREAYSNCEEKVIKPEVEHILLLSGGTDPFDVMENLLAQINREHYKQITVICGRYYDHYHALCAKYAAEQNVRILQNVSDIECHMKKADLAVSAGGTTLYELCAVGTPAISYSFADNQLGNVTNFEEDHLIDYAGDVRQGSVTERIVRYLEYYHHNQGLRRERSRNMQKLVDGKGALRIAGLLIE